MIELTNYKGNKSSIPIEDIEKFDEYYDKRYPSIKTIITLYDGKKIECSQSYEHIKKLIAVAKNHHKINNIKNVFEHNLNNIKKQDFTDCDLRTQNDKLKWSICADTDVDNIVMNLKTLLKHRKIISIELLRSKNEDTINELIASLNYTNDYIKKLLNI